VALICPPAATEVPLQYPTEVSAVPPVTLTWHGHRVTLHADGILESAEVHAA
jgi:hypothetical protein